ncbi:long-chain-fatty-acid--CoA ligase [Oceaniradius stylonematis]|uniref:long-chain-fatty-acid--CoA ligase n=1 Tax=Oceaniradius stylonematis TaxID=2184161 RepID=UPI00273DCA2C|nr:long-chain-fatty-acid--CoA ligase [Oceaniradius stylonematis]
MLEGMMMQRDLSIRQVLDYAADVYPETGVISSTVEGDRHRQTYGQTRKRVARLAKALLEMEVGRGDRVATLAWNGYRHFELYYAIAGIGSVCHTINPRLSAEQIAWIVNHADDKVLFFDLTFAPLVESLRPKLPPSIKLVLMTDEAHVPDNSPEGALCYETLLKGKPDLFDWPDLPETTASGLCYTSGTTGDPKGALYSHRSTLLHSFSVVLGALQCFGRGHRVLPVVPLFHVNAWGLPFSAPLTGTDLVMPGPHLDGASIFDLMQSEGVTSAWGVPTVWNGLIAEMRKRGSKPDALSTLLIGGSAVSEAMIRAAEEEFGIEVLHGWGMTEMSPVGTVTRPEPGLTADENVALKLPQGRRLFGVDMKIVDEAGEPLPHDGERSGELFVRGPTVISGYFNAPEASQAVFDADGWFSTGDMARIGPNTDLLIVDRTKDLIKSGGEWISSIDLENTACGCAGVAQAAAVAIPHPKWDERPLLVVVAEQGADVRKQDVLAHIGRRMAKWQVPDDVVFMDALPMTATGKISKLELRAILADYRFPDEPET